MPSLISPPEVIPSPVLLVPYQEVLLYVQNRLSAFLHGDLKQWVTAQGLNYSMVVNLKNDRLPKATPRLLQRLLTHFGFTTQAIRLSLPAQAVYGFVFSDEEAVQLFRRQLAHFSRPPSA